MILDSQSLFSIVTTAVGRILLVRDRLLGRVAWNGRTAVAQSTGGGDVPFYDRYYLGGLYSMRGYKFRNVSPREAFDQTAPYVPTEPIGGDSMWFGSVEYSLPILEKDGGIGLRFAVFYDIGSVSPNSYQFTGSFDDDYGVGIRLNIPHLGPLHRG